MMYNVPRKWGMVPERRYDDAVFAGWAVVLGGGRRSQVREDRRASERCALVERARGTSRRIRRSLGGDPPPAVSPPREEEREGASPSRRRLRLTVGTAQQNEERKRGLSQLRGPFRYLWGQ